MSDDKISALTHRFVQQVEHKAYMLYAQRGFEPGHEWDDWFEAEKIVEGELSPVDRDCIRSESFYKATHRSNPLPSDIDAQKFNTSPILKDF